MWKESNEKLAKNNSAFNLEFAESQSEGTYVNNVILPTIQATLKCLPLGKSTFVSSSECQSSVSVNKKDDGWLGKRPDIMIIMKHNGKNYKLLYTECSCLTCTTQKKKDDKVKLWREVNNEDYEILEVFQQYLKDKLVIVDETIKKIINNIHLDSYQYISKFHCIKNTFGKIIVEFFDLNNSESVRVVQSAVDDYFKYTCKHISHQSSQFINNLAEQFSCLTDSNIEPYIIANTVSNHFQNHQSCVNKLIQGLQLLSNTVNDYFDVSYPELYAKIKKLNLGFNIPKCFGAFPTVGINFNSICQFYRDLKDYPNTLCVMCSLGTFEDGNLAFPKLKLAIMAKQGQ
ncbi:8114_t:CDS:2, partial [Acaulospora morrowiae]